MNVNLIFSISMNINLKIGKKMDPTLIGSRQAQRVAKDIFLYHVCLIFLFIDHAIYPAAVAPPGGGARGESFPPPLLFWAVLPFLQIR